MKINIDANIAVDKHPFKSTGTTKSKVSNPSPMGACAPLGALDISGSVMDNNAYAGQGKTAEDVMQEAGAEDIVARRNYMAVMSNTMSKEDFAKLLKDGTHPGNTEIETVVTIIDHIKAALVKGGKEVHGYTDNIDAEKFAEITGCKVMGQKLASQFREKGLPLTEDNLKSTALAWEKAVEITTLSEGAMKYLVENQLPPTIENLYLAKYSGGNDAGKQGRGYFNIQPHYFAKKADSYDWNKLGPQIEKVIRAAVEEGVNARLKTSPPKSAAQSAEETKNQFFAAFGIR